MGSGTKVMPDRKPHLTNRSMRFEPDAGILEVRFGTIQWPRVPALPPRGHETVPERRALPHAKSAPSKSAILLPASTARTKSRRLSAMASSFAKSRRLAATSASSKANSGIYLKRPRVKRVLPAKTCSVLSSAAWITSSTGWASPPAAPRAASWSAMVTSR